MSKNPLVIGVAGGSGSGKTTVVNYICDEFAADNILRIEHDSYYRELQHLPFEERVKQN
ncbi:MAG TPA: uridine kinase, partial [Balneolaceae bacterium]|nr:uridine kinase [Balneolaceae bacterium]